MEVTILLPCLNEEKTIPFCVGEALSFLKKSGLEGEVLVTDNGSTDRSVQLAKKAGARVIHCKDKGYGNALRCGIVSAFGKYVIMGDCDCSYRFDDLMPFVEKLRSGADMVIGNRFAHPMEKGAMSFLHKLGVPFLSWLGRRRFKCDVKDFHCGLRAVNQESFYKLHCKCGGMEFATEMIGKASLAGMQISQLPVKLYCDKRGKKSHLRTVRDGLRHIRIIFKHK